MVTDQKQQKSACFMSQIFKRGNDILTYDVKGYTIRCRPKKVENHYYMYTEKIYIYNGYYVVSFP